MSKTDNLYQEYGEYNILYNQINLPSPSVDYAWRRTKKILQDEAIRLISNSVLDKKISVADIGCGNGALLIRIAQATSNLKNTEYKGLDISDTFINYGNQVSKFKKLSNIKFSHFNIEQENFSNKYDVLICSEVLEHLRDPKMALQKIFSSLNNNGSFLLSTPNSKNIIKYPFLFLKKLVTRKNSLEIEKFAAKKELKYLNSDSEQHLFVYSHRKLKKALKEIGFKIYKIPRSTMLFGGPFLDNHLLLFSLTMFADKVLNFFNIANIGWDNIIFCKKVPIL